MAYIKYVQSPLFEVLLFGYSVNGADVCVVDLTQGETIPDEILLSLTDNGIIKWAFNAQFERICLSAYLNKHYPRYFCSYSIEGDIVGNYLDPSSWRCSCVWSAYMGLPLSLAGVCVVLGLEEQKLKEGKELIRYFCMQCKPTKANGGRERNFPKHDILKWKRFISYNKRDVEVEMAIQAKLSKYPVPDFIWEEYCLDQEINDRGISLDMDIVRSAISIDERSKEHLTAKMKNLTGLDNPNSVLQMKQWLSDKGLETKSLDKKAVAGLLKNVEEPLRSVLILRQRLAKSSVKKYQAMENAVCEDGRARGMFQFYGANSKYALSSIVYCSKCGDIYRRIAWNNRGKCSNVWRCVTRVESGSDACDADTIQETELQEAVIKAINSILAQKSTAIGVLQENIEEVLKQENSSTKDVDGKLDELQKQLLQKANRNEKYDDLVEAVYKLREEKQRILADKAELEGVKQSIFNMKAFLNSQTAEIEEYDEQLVRRLIAKVTVYDEKFEVELKSGISVDIQRNK